MSVKRWDLDIEHVLRCPRIVVSATDYEALEAENAALRATVAKAELLAAHLQQLNAEIQAHVNKALEICGG